MSTCSAGGGEDAGKRREVLIRRHSRRQVTRGMTRKISELEMRLGDSQLAHDLVMASESQFAAKGNKGKVTNQNRIHCCFNADTLQ